MAAAPRPVIVRALRSDFPVIRERMRELYKDTLQAKEVPKFTNKQVKELTRVCEFVFRVYDKPKPHDQLTAERMDPTLSDEERMERWCELSDQECVVIKPLLLGAAVNFEHWDNEENKRERLYDQLRTTYGVVVRVMQDPIDKSLDVGVRCFETPEGYEMAHAILNGTKKGVSIHHLRTGTFFLGGLVHVYVHVSVVGYQFSVRELTVCWLGKRANTGLRDIIIHTNPEPLTQTSVPFFYPKHSDAVEENELARKISYAELEYDMQIVQDALSSCAQSKPLAAAASASASASAETKSRIHFSVLHSKAAMSTAAPMDISAPAPTTPAAAAPAGAPTPTPVSTPAAAPVPVPAPAPLSAAPVPSFPGSVTPQAAVPPASATPNAIVQPEAMPAANQVHPFVAAPAPAPTPAAAPVPVQQTSGHAGGVAPMDTSDMDTSSDNTGNSGSGSVLGKRSRESSISESDKQDAVDQIHRVLLEHGGQIPESTMSMLRPALNALLQNHVNALESIDQLKRESNMHERQLDQQKLFFNENLRSIMEYVLGPQFTDMDAQSLKAASNMPTTAPLGEFYTSMASMALRAAKAVDLRKALATKKTLERRMAPVPTLAAASSSGTAIAAAASVTSTPAAAAAAAAAPSAAPPSATAAAAAAAAPTAGAAAAAAPVPTAGGSAAIVAESAPGQTSLPTGVITGVTATSLIAGGAAPAAPGAAAAAAPAAPATAGAVTMVPQVSVPKHELLINQVRPMPSYMVTNTSRPIAAAASAGTGIMVSTAASVAAAAAGTTAASAASAGGNIRVSRPSDDSALRAAREMQIFQKWQERYHRRQAVRQDMTANTYTPTPTPPTIAAMASAAAATPAPAPAPVPMQQQQTQPQPQPHPAVVSAPTSTVVVPASAAAAAGQVSLDPTLASCFPQVVAAPLGVAYNAVTMTPQQMIDSAASAVGSTSGAPSLKDLYSKAKGVSMDMDPDAVDRSVMDAYHFTPPAAEAPAKPGSQAAIAAAVKTAREAAHNFQ